MVQNDQRERCYRLMSFTWSTTDRTNKNEHSQSENPFKSQEKGVPQNISREISISKNSIHLPEYLKVINIVEHTTKGRNHYLPIVKRLKKLSLQNWCKSISEKKKHYGFCFLMRKCSKIRQPSVR